jgi:hypothetical protein
MRSRAIIARLRIENKLCQKCPLGGRLSDKPSIDNGESNVKGALSMIWRHDLSVGGFASAPSRR